MFRHNDQYIEVGNLVDELLTTALAFGNEGFDLSDYYEHVICRNSITMSIPY